jgi:hypothetical protein
LKAAAVLKLKHGMSRTTFTLHEKDGKRYVSNGKNSYVWKHYHLTPVAFDYGTAATETVALDKWIGKAVSKDEDSPDVWKRVHYGNLGLNGYRVHIDNSIAPLRYDEIKPGALDLVTSWRKTRIRPAKMDAVELSVVVKQVKALRKDMVRVRIRGRVELSAKSENGMKGAAKIKADYTGKDIEVHINPKFLLDALSGMEGEISLRLVGKIIWITNGSREAFIMTMTPG